MSFNSFGETFRVTTFGESHGPAVGVVIDGVAPGIAFDVDEIQRDLERRRPGQSHLTTARVETDRLRVLSGVFEGKTTGTPICLLVENGGGRSADYDGLARVFRPGHGDLTYWKKYGIRDFRGGGRASGRETVSRVAAGAFARQILAGEGVKIWGFVREIAGIGVERIDPELIERSPVRCPDSLASRKMVAAIEEAQREGDSVGGVVEVRADGVPAGWGDPVFHKLDAHLASALMSIGGVKAVEVGDGFQLSRCRGQEANDAIGPQGFATNHHGGILAGISSGAPIVVRVAVKPTPSIAQPQRTVDLDGAPRTISVGGRHDPCICPRLVPVAEAMVALVLVDAMLRQHAISGEEATASDEAAALRRLDVAVLELVAERRAARAGALERAGVVSGVRSAGRRRELGELGEALGLEPEVVQRLAEILEPEGGVSHGG